MASVLLAGLSACAPLRTGYDGVNLFPLFRYATQEDGEGLELSFLWPVFEYQEHTGTRPEWSLREGPEPTDRHFSFFPLFYYRDVHVGLSRDTTWQLTGLFGSHVVRDEYLGRETLRSMQLMPFLLDDVFRYETGGANPDDWNLRLLFNEVGRLNSVAYFKMLEVVRDVPLATLLRLQFDQDAPEGLAEELSGSEWELARVLGFQLLRFSSRGAYREAELLSAPAGELASLFRMQWRKGDAPADHESHLAPLYTYRETEDAKNVSVLWPLWSYEDSKDGTEIRWLYFLRFHAAPAEVDEPEQPDEPGPEGGAATR